MILLSGKRIKLNDVRHEIGSKMPAFQINVICYTNMFSQFSVWLFTFLLRNNLSRFNNSLHII